MALDPELLRKTLGQNKLAQPKIVEELNEGVGDRRAGAGIFRDVFDILQRPQRAVSTAALNLVDDDPNTGALSGALAGISGKAKTSWSDVLKTQGIEGPAGAIAGFAGDVLLDPLTYVGVRSDKGLSGFESVNQAAQRLSKNRMLLTDDAVESLAQTLQAQNPAHLYVTFAGKKVVGTTALPKAGRRVKDALIGEEGNRSSLAKAFSRKSELPFGLADKARVYEASNSAHFDSHIKGVRDIFLKNLTEDERKLITHAIEDVNTDRLNVPLTKADGHPEGFTSLGDYQDLAQKIFKRYFDDEAALGIMKPEQYRANYVHHYYNKPPSNLLPGQIKSLETLPAGPNRSNFQMARKAGSIRQAKELGYEPVEDIAEILSIRSAKHYRTVGRTAFVNDAAETFGVKLNKKNRQWLKDHGYVAASKNLNVAHASTFKNVYLPEPIVRAINNTEMILRDGTVGSKALKNYDKIMNHWKFLNTSANPGYHVRNSITDYFMNLADGVHNPAAYAQARKVLSDVRVHNSDKLLEIAGGTPMRAGYGKVRIGDDTYTTSEIWDMYTQSGAKSGQITAELNRNVSALENQGMANYLSTATQALGEPGKVLDTAMKATRQVPKVIGDFSDTREDFFRVAHFLDAFKKELQSGKPKQAAIEAAGNRVRKFNIDYGMLSSFERNTARRLVPFYSFMRRNLPLQVELLFTKPGFMALYPKGTDLMQGLLGTEDGEGEALIPEWIRDSYPVRVAMAKQEANSPLNKLLQKVSGAKEGDAVFVPTVGSLAPVGDLMNLGSAVNDARRAGGTEGIRELARVGVNMLTPAIKAPVELATGRSTYTGGPITDWSDWLAGQVSQTRIATNLDQPRSVTGWATGIPLQPVTEARQASEFRRQEDVLQEVQRRYKEKFLAERGMKANPNLLGKVQTPDTAAIKRYLQSARPEVKATT